MHMGGGIIIQQNSAVKAAVQSPAVWSQLPAPCLPKATEICNKGCVEWTEEEYAYMVVMLTLCRHP